MLPDKTRAGAVLLLDGYLRLQFLRHFQRVEVHGFDGYENSLSEPDGPPLIFYGNHQSWWDGFFMFSLGRRLGLEFRVIMEEKNLRRFSFFRLTGAFGVDLSSIRGRAESLLHAVRLLRGKGKRRRCLTIYPHGTLISPWMDPWPPFQPGLEALLRLCPSARAVPIIHEIVPGPERLPVVWIEIGKPLEPGFSSNELEAALLAVRRTMRARIDAKG